MKRTSELIVKLRWFIMCFFIVVSAIFGLQIRKAEIDPAMKTQLPPDMPSRVITDKIDELFGGTEMIMIMLKSEDVLNPETLKRTKALTQKMKRVRGIDKVLSLFELKSIKGEEGAMIVDPAVKRIPETQEQRERLRQDIRENDMVYGNVVSEDFTATAVIGLVETDVSDDFIVSEANRIVRETTGDEEILIGGLPNVRKHVSEDIQSDVRRLMPVGLLIMLVFLFISFRQLRGVLLPFFVVVMSILFAVGLIPLLGWKIYMVTILLPIMLIAIANDYGIHLIARYQEDNVGGSGITKGQLARGIFESLYKPIILTGLTTIAGMLCLMSHIIVPAEQLGILSSAGILFALLASLFFIPAMLSIIPKAKPITHNPGQTARVLLLDRMLAFLGGFVAQKPRGIIIFMALLTIASAVGIFFVEVDTNPNNYYFRDSPIVRANDLANEKFGGSTNISVVVQSDIKSPEIMRKIDRIERELRDMQDIGNTVSIARALRQMSRALNDEDERWYDKIPDTRNAIAQYLELYSMSGDPEDFEKLVDFPYEHAQITARINEVSSKKINGVLNRVRDMTRDDEDVEFVGGFATILGELATMIVRGQLISLFAAVAIVGLFIMIMFRSIVAGILSCMPLALSITILFGSMGYFGIELNIPTAMLSSIMIGVGVDYTIHFLWRYREERRGGLEPIEGVRRTLTTSGRGIIFNALSVIVGFAVLLISNFLPVRFFGFLVVVSIGACLVGALVLVPSLCIVLRPRFLEPKGVEQGG